MIHSHLKRQVINTTVSQRKQFIKTHETEGTPMEKSTHQKKKQEKPVSHPHQQETFISSSLSMKYFYEE